jgi:hypothetical protein
MPKPKRRPIPDVRVADPEAAFHRLEGFTRKIMGVPKKEIESTPHRKVRKIKGQA